jgi:hypothetical protein
MPRRRTTEVPWYAELLADLILSAIAASVLFFVVGAPLPYAIVGGLAFGFGCVYCCLHVDWTANDRPGGGGSDDGFWASLRNLLD